MRNKTLYITSNVTHGAIARLLRRGDVAWGPTPGHISVAKIATEGGGSYHIVRGDGWGCDTDDADTLAGRIHFLHSECRKAGIVPMRTASSTARKMFTDMFDGARWTSALPAQWRGLSHAAIHGGPVVVVSGGGGRYGPSVVCADMHRAYWHALREPMPLVGMLPNGAEGRYIIMHGGGWKAVADKTGIIEATVRVTAPTGIGAIPALPVRMASTQQQWLYPYGEMRGVWTIAQVNDAVQRRECEVLEIHQCAVSNKRYPVFRDMMDYIAESVHKDVGKLLYTRLYGGCGSQGGFEGLPDDNGIDWTSKRTGMMDNFGKPTYRPDWAAMVTGWNHRKMMSALRSLDETKTVAVHVDAIWTQDLDGAFNLPDPWRIKVHGNIRYYANGRYTYWPTSGGEPVHAAQGYVGVLDDGQQQRMGDAGGEAGTRAWKPREDSGAAYPWTHSDAQSWPMRTYDPSVRSVVAHPNIRDERWGRDGKWRA